MTIDIVTLFPKLFKGPFNDSIIKRGVEKEIITINIHNLRNWARGKHKQADDTPYGGGEGMVLKLEPVYRAVEELIANYAKKKGEIKKKKSHVILTTPSGRQFNYRIASKLANLTHLIIVCGHYEGVDQRIFEFVADERLSIGDYILTGGEIPSMVIVDSISRLVPGVISKEESRKDESFSYENGLLKYPQYTRPEEFEGIKVPEILLSGNHKEIENWRKEQAKELTRSMRPDLLDNNEK